MAASASDSSTGGGGGPRDAHSGNAMAGQVRVQMSFPSDYNRMRDVQTAVMDAVADFKFDDESTFGIKLSLEEGLINAIKHGNKLDPAKNVHVIATIDRHRLEVTIRDEGPGFERTGVPDPTLEENLEKCSGRGLLLIENYMDEVEYTNNGRTLRMLRRNRATA